MPSTLSTIHFLSDEDSIELRFVRCEPLIRILRAIVKRIHFRGQRRDSVVGAARPSMPIRISPRLFQLKNTPQDLTLSVNHSLWSSDRLKTNRQFRQEFHLGIFTSRHSSGFVHLRFISADKWEFVPKILGQTWGVDFIMIARDIAARMPVPDSGTSPF
jgi:hypothetical protein